MFLGQPLAATAVFSDQDGDAQQSKREIVLPPSLLCESGIPGRIASATTIDIRLPREVLLRREIPIPAGSSRAADRIAALDLARRTPLRPTDVHTVLSAPKRIDGARMSVQWVAKSSEVAALRARLASSGYTVRKVFVADGPTLAPLADFSAEIAPRRALWRRANALLLLAATGLLILGWTRPALESREDLRNLEAMLATLRTDAVTLRREVDALEGSAAERTAFLSSVVDRPKLVNTLRDMTVALPDTVWLSDLSFRPERLVLTGSAADSAADLVLTLTGRAGLSNPRLTGPVSRTPDGSERFEIAVDLVAAQ
ncbi:PilN domain-containing protein [Defluviimonas salinarum]|uniref:PilN domain-containing protein n=1 Tax=Defluviimonas salinarum TaxID=2992147 RepID=A0ABT3J789_9RHOB|nr:PilN domain-containing protein [Defluviimonas salinarum]MCW3783544.1 PilN domain-containing protein [Defluviimonas salinarum]